MWTLPRSGFGRLEDCYKALCINARSGLRSQKYFYGILSEIDKNGILSELIKMGILSEIDKNDLELFPA